MARDFRGSLPALPLLEQIEEGVAVGRQRSLAHDFVSSSLRSMHSDGMTSGSESGQRRTRRAMTECHTPDSESQGPSSRRYGPKRRSSSVAKAFDADSQKELELLCLEYQKQGSHQQLHIEESLAFSETKLQWGLGWSWHAHTPRLPPHVNGVPYDARPFSVLPPSSEVPEKILERYGNGALCLTGKKDSTTCVCQDFLSISHLRGVSKDGWQVYVVADGHGKDGHLVAHRLVQTLPFYLSSVECRSLLWKGRVDEALYMAFEYAERDVTEHSRQENFDLLVSGSTATCILRWAKSKKIYVASVGDSCAVMFDKSGNVLQATQPHHPNLPEERARIERAGGEVREEEYFQGARVFRRGRQFPGLAVSRSFGDLVAKECGVSAVPEILVWDAPDGAYVFASSDGVWEFMDAAEVAAHLAKELARGLSPMAMLGSLTARSQGLWWENEGDSCDDTSCVLFPVKAVAAASPLPLNPVGCWSSCCPWFRRSKSTTGLAVSKSRTGSFQRSSS
mmetsp:Transcript_22302/g.51983  ORF Transcript_22302/g.51983 Transcript_22302/m.51983 type:complete len:508 (+) Transcript_22302:92-1615(+)